MKALFLVSTLAFSSVSFAGSIAAKCNSLLSEATVSSMKYGVASDLYTKLVASGEDPFQADRVLNKPMVQFDYTVNQFRSCVIELDGGDSGHRGMKPIGKKCWELADDVFETGMKYGVALDQSKTQAALKLKGALDYQMNLTYACIYNLEKASR